jgi:hypothetical protein
MGFAIDPPQYLSLLVIGVIPPIQTNRAIQLAGILPVGGHVFRPWKQDPAMIPKVGIGQMA